MSLQLTEGTRATIGQWILICRYQGHITDPMPVSALQIAKLSAELGRGGGAVHRRDRHDMLDRFGRLLREPFAEIRNRRGSNPNEMRNDFLALASLHSHMPGDQAERLAPRPYRSEATLGGFPLRTSRADG
ncbi:hypothetical protein IU427_29980 [Nocardia beijingensis]|uniref:hypothetical protein n=1 Tax=Nocardia beijingensis TaxID=95162 RepID=UPI0018963228|nr:hypothetical protein [Nocardia beijingensis]MBF6469365.1 hypothetical protein [Nocardia beijingensis]